MADPSNHTQDDKTPDGREKYKVAGDKVVSTVKELIHEGNVRHVVIKNDDGRTLIEFPVAIGVAGAVLLPVWAAVGAVAALVTKCTIEVEREPESDDVEDAQD
jgi:hypothetical protein